MTGGLVQWKARLVAAQAQREELKLAKDLGDSIPWADAQMTISTLARVARQRLDALPAEVAHLCNPTDPEHARIALEQWVASSLPIIRGDTDKLRAASGPPE
jgi:hypothetical protein